MDLGSEQPEKKTSKKLKARGKGDECVELFWTNVSILTSVTYKSWFSLAFRVQRSSKSELSALQICRNLPGCCGGTHESAGCPKKRGGNNFPSSATLSDIVCIHVCSDDLLVKLVFS